MDPLLFDSNPAAAKQLYSSLELQCSGGTCEMVMLDSNVSVTLEIVINPRLGIPDSLGLG